METFNDSEVIVGVNVKEERRYAGFWLRFWAYLVDVIVIASLNGFLLSPFKFVNEGFPIHLGYWTANGMVAAIVFYLYFLLMTKYFGQTLGKMIFGLKVINEHDGELTWNDLFFREVVGRFIYNVIGIMKVLYIVVAFTNEKQGIHDIVGRTRVIHVN